MRWLEHGARHFALLIRHWESRLRLWLNARRLRAAEAELGEMGWQRCDFSGGVGGEVERVGRIERSQLDLLNQRASLSADVSECERKLAEIERSSRDHRSRLEAELERAQREFEQAHAEAESAAGAVARFETACGELETEHQAALADGDDARPEWIVRDELVDMRRRRDEQSTLLAGLRTAAESARGRRQRLAAELDEHTARSSDEHGREQRRLAGLTAERRKIERELRHCESSKRPSFRALGAEMADYGIEPMNQPQYLERVVRLRQARASLLECGERLRDRRAAIPAASYWTFYAFALLALCAALAAWLR